MNKTLYEYFLQEMARYNGHAGFDAWGLKEDADIYHLLRGRKLIEIQGIRYTIYERKGGGCGMGEYPARLYVTQVTDITPEYIQVE